MGREEIRPGVSLETREYGDDAAPALVVWGHGLCNSLEGEDAERLWDFWNDDDDDDGAPAPGPGPPPRSFRCPRTMRVVRYAARGHGDSSPADRPEDCTWETLGRDMLALARRRRRDASQKLILGGASMGSASALYAARHALDDAVAGSNPTGANPEIDGLVLVILPTFHDTRRRRGAQIVAAAERGYDATASRKKIRPIFRGTEREDEPPIAMGVRPDSFEHVMRASAVSDLPSAEDMSSRASSHPPTLALCWDCGDATHPGSSAARLAELVPSARVRVARSLEETREWPRMIRDFVGGL